MNLVDTHAHLDFDQFDGEVDEVRERAKEAGVATIITVGTTLSRSEKAVTLADAYPEVFASVGVHPHDAGDVDDQAIEKVRELSANPRVVAIGEIGFDFHYDDGPDEQTQVAAFLAQAAVAAERGLPIIVHSRDAEEVTVRQLDAVLPSLVNDPPGVVHCFDGSPDFANAVLERGFLLSFTAIIGYPKNDRLRGIVKEVPLDRMMVETDCPFLAPQSKRGERNEPAFVVETASKIAELKGVPVDEVADATTATANRLFKLDRG